ncbi:MAG: carbohydrate porin [Candidatus Omnitrophica bacterium]|jgi:porin|nr:carbohydrate porin [Candidatus Omnitrophota bacterium]
MKKILALVMSLFLLSCSAFAQDQPVLPAVSQPNITSTNFISKIFNFLGDNQRTSLTGNWGGARDRLSEQGIDIVSSYTIDLLTNDVGGLREHRFQYDSSLGLDINVNLEKTSNLTGLQFHLSGLWREGKNLSADIGNRFPPSSIFGSEQVRLYNLYLEQAMFNNRVSLKAGRLGAGDDFAQSPLYWIFLTNSIDGCPISLPINFFFTVYPTATWGARLKVSPVSAFTWKGAIYHQDSGVGRNAAHGADFTWRRNKGILFIQELSFLPNQYEGASGLPGNYKLGLFYSTGRFKDYYQDENGNSYAETGLDQKRRYGNYGMYLHADQMLYREPGTSDQGFTPFFVLCLQPAKVNELPFFIDAALTYKGLIPGRDNDVTGLGFAYGRWSRQLNKYQNDSGKTPQKYEIVLETTYKIAINKWLYFQPDIQYIMNANGGNKNVDDALVTGARIGATF